MNKTRLTLFMPKSIIVTIVLTTLIVNVIKSCPLVCTCKWKGGKRKVECANKNLTSLLSGIDPETQVLDYSKNHLHTLTHRLFEEKKLVDLQKLFLFECQIVQIQDTAFYGLANLIELDLANNMLTSVPSNTFKDYSLLMKLILSGNPIRELSSRAFLPLESLGTLDLSDCQIDTIEKEAFDGLQKLEWLKLEGNKLKNWKFAEKIPEVTSGLSLHRNPWICDCHLRSFYTWLISANKGSLMTADPVCDEPKPYRELSIAQLKIEDLACAPSVIPSSLFVEINEGKNISFTCQVNAVPEAEITWDFEGGPINNNSCFVTPFYKFYAEDEITEQGSELYIVDARKENNGTYQCTATNIAGKSMSNFTLKVIETLKVMPPITANSHFHIIVSSVGTLMLVTIIALLFLICLAYFHKKRPAITREAEKKRTNVRPEVGYEIIKLDETESSSPCKTDNVRNPDVIINAENTNDNKLEASEQFIFLRGGVQQPYATLLGTGASSSPGVCPQENVSLLCRGIEGAAIAPTNVIQFYMPSSTESGVHGLYVNPFESYDNPIEDNYWTIHLLKNDSSGPKQFVSFNKCDQVAPQKTKSSSSSSNTLNDEVVNLRHNLEGYPYPSKLKLSPVGAKGIEELVSTPILSPPDPFKTSDGGGIENGGGGKNTKSKRKVRFTDD